MAERRIDFYFTGRAGRVGTVSQGLERTVAACDAGRDAPRPSFSDLGPFEAPSARIWLMANFHDRVAAVADGSCRNARHSGRILADSSGYFLEACWPGSPVVEARRHCVTTTPAPTPGRRWNILRTQCSAVARPHYQPAYAESSPRLPEFRCLAVISHDAGRPRAGNRRHVYRSFRSPGFRQRRPGLARAKPTGPFCAMQRAIYLGATTVATHEAVLWPTPTRCGRQACSHQDSASGDVHILRPLFHTNAPGLIRAGEPVGRRHLLSFQPLFSATGSGMSRWSTACTWTSRRFP